MNSVIKTLFPQTPPRQDGGLEREFERSSTLGQCYDRSEFRSVVYIIVEVLKLLEHPSLGLRLTNAATW